MIHHVKVADGAAAAVVAVAVVAVDVTPVAVDADEIVVTGY